MLLLALHSDYLLYGKDQIFQGYTRLQFLQVLVKNFQVMLDGIALKYVCARLDKPDYSILK